MEHKTRLNGCLVSISVWILFAFISVSLPVVSWESGVATYLISNVTRLQYWLVCIDAANFWKNSERRPALERWISWKVSSRVTNFLKVILLKGFKVHLQWHWLGDHREDLIKDIIGELLTTGTRSELGEPGVMFQSTEQGMSSSLSSRMIKVKIFET